MPLSRRIFAASAGAFAMHLAAPGRLTAAPARPKLLILLILGQFRTDYLARADRFLSPGGFRRLMREASFFPNCCYLSTTFSAGGLATLSSGSYPEVHGVVADQWYDRMPARVVAAGPGHLGASTLAEEAAQGRARVFVFGSQEAHAGILAGRANTRLFSMNAGGEFVARGERPEWLSEYNRLHPVENSRDAKWVALGASAGVPPLRVLTYNPERPEDFYALYRSSPFAQASQFEFLRELVAREKMGQGETFDFLAASLDPTALLGYETGADSPLMEQMVLHLDRELEFTLEMLNKTVGAGRYMLALTAAHGAVQAPEPAARAQVAVNGEALARALDRALAERLDTASARVTRVEKYVYPFLYLQSPARTGRETRLAAGRTALTMPQVAGFFTADGDCSHYGAWQRRFRNSFQQPRSGDLMLSYKPGYVEDYGAGRGISYGSLYNYDARVPLFLYGPPFRPGIYEKTVESVDVAPTLASAAGIAPPSSSTGTALAPAFGRREVEE
jgi:hypothetical protein